MYWNAVPFTAVQSSTSRCLKIHERRFSMGRSRMLMMLSNGAVVAGEQFGISSERTT